MVTALEPGTVRTGRVDRIDAGSVYVTVTDTGNAWSVRVAGWPALAVLTAGLPVLVTADASGAVWITTVLTPVDDVPDPPAPVPPAASTRYAANTQTLTNNVITPLIFELSAPSGDVPTDDPTIPWEVNVSNPTGGGWRPTVSGLYLLTARFSLAANGTGMRYGYVNVGGARSGRTSSPPTAGAVVSVTIAQAVPVLAGQLVTVDAYQSSGGDLVTVPAVRGVSGELVRIPTQGPAVAQ